jgi:hypothetical protein
MDAGSSKKGLAAVSAANGLTYLFTEIVDSNPGGGADALGADLFFSVPGSEKVVDVLVIHGNDKVGLVNVQGQVISPSSGGFTLAVRDGGVGIPPSKFTITTQAPCYATQLNVDGVDRTFVNCDLAAPVQTPTTMAGPVSVTFSVDGVSYQAEFQVDTNQRWTFQAQQLAAIYDGYSGNPENTGFIICQRFNSDLEAALRCVEAPCRSEDYLASLGATQIFNAVYQTAYSFNPGVCDNNFAGAQAQMAAAGISFVSTGPFYSWAYDALVE